MLLVAIALAAFLLLLEWRRWPTRKHEVARARALEADANDSLKVLIRMAKRRAKSKAIPLPIMPEETTDVIALHPHRRHDDEPVEDQRRRTPTPSEYRIVAAHKRGK